MGVVWNTRRHPGIPSGKLLAFARDPLWVQATSTGSKKRVDILSAVGCVGSLRLFHPQLLYPDRAPRIHTTCLIGGACFDFDRITGAGVLGAQRATCKTKSRLTPNNRKSKDR